jgi:5-bromo-4-chloroindolyl phosphate hydrolysis protein
MSINPDTGFGISIVVIIIMVIIGAMKLMPSIISKILVGLAVVAMIYFGTQMTPTKQKYSKAGQALDRTSTEGINKPHRMFDIDTY